MVFSGTFLIAKKFIGYMCGIIGYVGNKEALPILLDGLRRLEYRGYDSAGVAIVGDRQGSTLGRKKGRTLPGIVRVRAVGKVAALAASCEGKKLVGTAGIGHARWATHGKPTEKNAHPHADCTGRFAIVHNGIIENYGELKEELKKKKHRFKSDTDSEVIAHLIEEEYRRTRHVEGAVQSALRKLRGTYGLAVVSSLEPGKIVAARLGAPICIGLGKGENFVASDVSPLIPYTRNVLYLDDGETGILTEKECRVCTLDDREVTKEAETVLWSEAELQKDGFPHFTLKEIKEASEVAINTLRGRLLPENGLAKLGGLERVSPKLREAKRVIFVGCGTALHAARAGECMLEEYAGLPAEVEIASEFRYRKPVLESGTVVIAVSQSGETADTLEAIREAKRKGVTTLGIVNVVGSTIAREVDAGIYNHAGPEVSVLSTKAYISQLIVLALLTLYFGREQAMSLSMGRSIAAKLRELPKKLEKVLACEKDIRRLAKKYAKYEHALYLGRKYNFATAFEGALKVKEASYIHAEGCGAGEMKHGFIAMIDKQFPTVAIAPRDSVYDGTVAE
jgi:glucosamine--fructose-6-phosphate aminotransferase (isomerizing)